jgi:hypothetical protein
MRNKRGASIFFSKKAWLVMLFLISISFASAAVEDWPIGGQISDLSNNPIEGSFTGRFRFYDFNDAVVWEQYIDFNTSKLGIYYVIANVSGVEFNQTLWLGRQIGTATEQAPRMIIAPVASSHIAYSVNWSDIKNVPNNLTGSSGRDGVNGTVPNSSFQCSNTADRIFNVSFTSGQLNAECANDETGSSFAFSSYFNQPVNASDSVRFASVNASINASYVQNAPWGFIGSCPSGQVMQNSTSTGVQCVNDLVGGSGVSYNQSLNTSDAVRFHSVNASLNWIWLLSIPSYVKDWLSDIQAVNNSANSRIDNENLTQASAINLKLTASDQRYNETSKIDSNSSSFSNRLNTLESNNVTQAAQISTLNSNNVTVAGWITTLNSNNVSLAGRITTLESNNVSLAGTVSSNNQTLTTNINAKHTPSTCTGIQVVQNTTTSGVQCFTPTVAETDSSAFISINQNSSAFSGRLNTLESNNVSLASRIANVNLTALQSGDQRYNETGKIDSNSSWLTAMVNNVNATRAGVGSCVAGQVVQNTTSTGVSCLVIPGLYNVTYNFTNNITLNVTNNITTINNITLNVTNNITNNITGGGNPFDQSLNKTDTVSFGYSYYNDGEGYWEFTNNSISSEGFTARYEDSTPYYEFCQQGGGTLTCENSDISTYFYMSSNTFTYRNDNVCTETNGYCTGGGVSYNQSLNTSDSVVFNSINGSVNASWILNAPWITSYTENDPKALTDNSTQAVLISAKLESSDQRYNETSKIDSNSSWITAMINNVNATANARAVVGTGTCGVSVMQNFTLSSTPGINPTVQCINVSGGSFVFSNYFNQGVNTSNDVVHNSLDVVNLNGNGYPLNVVCSNETGCELSVLSGSNSSTSYSAICLYSNVTNVVGVKNVNWSTCMGVNGLNYNDTSYRGQLPNDAFYESHWGNLIFDTLNSSRSIYFIRPGSPNITDGSLIISQTGINITTNTSISGSIALRAFNNTFDSGANTIGFSSKQYANRTLPIFRDESGNIQVMSALPVNGKQAWVGIQGSGTGTTVLGDLASVTGTASTPGIDSVGSYRHVQLDINATGASNGVASIQGNAMWSRNKSAFARITFRFLRYTENNSNVSYFAGLSDNGAPSLFQTVAWTGQDTIGVRYTNNSFDDKNFTLMSRSSLISVTWNYTLPVAFDNLTHTLYINFPKESGPCFMQFDDLPFVTVPGGNCSNPNTNMRYNIGVANVTFRNVSTQGRLPRVRVEGIWLQEG